jgi:type I restriction enzyme R subunit
VLLTHLRTDLVAEREDLSLGEGEPEPLPGLPGEGRGRQADEPRRLLSQLIDALNERFGAGLGEADLLWFEQQQIELRSDHDVRAVALHNDEQQFSVFLKLRIEQAIVERHQANGELFESYFASDERRELIDEFLIRSLCGVIRG